MSEARAVYPVHDIDVDPGCPPQFCERLSDSVVRIMGVLAEVCEYQGWPYWRALERCAEHNRAFVSYQTAQGHLTPFRHAVVDERECVSWCYPRKDESDGDR